MFKYGIRVQCTQYDVRGMTLLLHKESSPTVTDTGIYKLLEKCFFLSTEQTETPACRSLCVFMFFGCCYPQ